MVTIARVSRPNSGLVFQSDKVKLKIGNKVIDTGTLYVSVNSLAWQPETASEDGISISWREVSVQGISSEPVKCIYFMLDHKLVWRGIYDETEANGHNGDPAEIVMDQQAADEGVESDDEDEGNISDEYNENPEMTECWLLPDDLNTVDIIYQSMNDCQALHPDPADSPDDLMDSADDDEDGEDYDEEEFDADGRMQNLNLN